MARQGGRGAGGGSGLIGCEFLLTLPEIFGCRVMYGDPTTEKR